jgi:hypothetical protein
MQRQQGRGGTGARPRSALLCGIGLMPIAWLAACATAPVDQIHQFSTVFDTVNAAGQPLLDDLSIAERSLGTRNAPNRPAPAEDTCSYTSMRSTGVVLGLCNRDAPLFSDIGDPPDTRRLRNGLVILQRYIDVLVGFADGKATADTVAQANALLQKLGDLASLAGVPAKPGVDAALLALRPLLTDVVNQLSAREARQLIVNSKQPVSDLIIALRDATPSVFNAVTTDTESQLGKARSPTLAADKAKYEAYRRIAANYYVLLDQLNDAWTETVAAAQTTSPASIAELAHRAGQLQADAEAVKRAFASLRTGTMPAGP